VPIRIKIFSNENSLKNRGGGQFSVVGGPSIISGVVLYYCTQGWFEKYRVVKDQYINQAFLEN
jgi:hypothetical protein